MCRKDLLHLRYDVFRLSEYRVPVDPEDHTQPTLLSFFALLGVKQLISTATNPFGTRNAATIRLRMKASMSSDSTHVTALRKSFFSNLRRPPYYCTEFTVFLFF